MIKRLGNWMYRLKTRSKTKKKRVGKLVGLERNWDEVDVLSFIRVIDLTLRQERDVPPVCSNLRARVHTPWDTEKLIRFDYY